MSLPRFGSLLLLSSTLVGCPNDRAQPPESQVSSVESDQVTASAPTELDRDLQQGAGLYLAKVVGLAKRDERPADGDLTVVVTLEVVRSSGVVRDPITVLEAYGGLWDPAGPGPPAHPPGPLRADSLEIGQRYWFLSSTSKDLYPSYIARYWPENSPEAEALEEAVRSARFGP